jgi:hypothetical protein
MKRAAKNRQIVTLLKYRREETKNGKGKETCRSNHFHGGGFRAMVYRRCDQGGTD